MNISELKLYDELINKTYNDGLMYSSARALSNKSL